MKTKDLCKEYGFDQSQFEKYLKDYGVKHKSGLTGTVVEDAEVAQIVSDYREVLGQDEQKRKALAEMLITSGFTFDGYKIKKYSGYISGDDCITMPRDNFWGSNRVDENLCGALVKIRRQAIKELKEAAYNLGCNAVIGVDFDYLTMDPQHSSALNSQVTVYEPYVICVTANGNAVVIEKEE